MCNTRQGTLFSTVWDSYPRHSFNLSIKCLSSCLAEPKCKIPSSSLIWGLACPQKATVEERAVVPFTCIAQKYKTHELLSYFCQQMRATGRTTLIYFYGTKAHIEVGWNNLKWQHCIPLDCGAFIECIHLYIDLEESTANKTIFFCILALLPALFLKLFPTLFSSS